VSDSAAEILGGDDRGSVDRPEVREFDALLFEDCLSSLPVTLHDIATFPCDLVIGMQAWSAKDALDCQTLSELCLSCLAIDHRVRHFHFSIRKKIFSFVFNFFL